jgi:tRNA-specific 2-thiouridylase
MVQTKAKVLIALSGGVDSSTAAALLLDAGYDCAGVFFRTNDQSSQAQANAEDVAERLGMKLFVLDLRSDFEHILDYLCDEYSRGRTPNPCVFCNKYIKFGKLWDFAREHGAHFLATGHYARILNHNGRAGLYGASDPFKDQSYILSMVDKDILPYIIFPIGVYSKNQVRQLAAKFGLGTEDKADSQEICFIPDNNYVLALERRRPQLFRRGDIVDSHGTILGEHDGVHRFTIGQRQGLGVAMGKPYYVSKLDAKCNTVTLGPSEEIMHKKLRATSVNWLVEKPRSLFRAIVKVRYNDKGSLGNIVPQGNDVSVEFDKPRLAITPGQLAVFYVKQGRYNKVFGAGWIDEADN